MNGVGAGPRRAPTASPARRNQPASTLSTVDMLTLLFAHATAIPPATEVHAVVQGRFAEVTVQSVWEDRPLAAMPFVLPHDAVIRGIRLGCSDNATVLEPSATLSSTVPGLAKLKLSGNPCEGGQSQLTWSYVQPLESPDLVIPQGISGVSGPLSVEVELRVPDVWRPRSLTHEIETQKIHGRTVMSWSSCDSQHDEVVFSWDQPQRRVEPFLSDSALDLTIRPDIVRDFPPDELQVVALTLGGMSRDPQTRAFLQSLAAWQGKPLDVLSVRSIAAGMAFAEAQPRPPGTKLVIVLLAPVLPDPALLMERVPPREDMTVFTIGLGPKVDRVPLTDFAHHHGGASTILAPHQPPHETAQWLFDRLSHPPLTDVRVALDDDTIHAAGTLWNGDPLRLRASWEQHPPTQARVTGMVAGQEVSFVAPIDTVKSIRHEALEVLSRPPGSVVAARPTRTERKPETCPAPQVVKQWASPKPTVAADVVRASDPRGRVEETVMRNAGSLQYCYEKELKANPGVTGKIMMRFRIDAGRVTQAAMQDASPEVGGVGTCAAQKMRRWRFPPEAQAEVDVVFTLATGR